MAQRVIGPRRSWDSLAELAKELGSYVERVGPCAYRLKPLDPAAYNKWHANVWAPAQQAKTREPREGVS